MCVYINVIFKPNSQSQEREKKKLSHMNRNNNNNNKISVNKKRKRFGLDAFFYMKKQSKANRIDQMEMLGSAVGLLLFYFSVTRASRCRCIQYIYIECIQKFFLICVLEWLYGLDVDLLLVVHLLFYTSICYVNGNTHAEKVKFHLNEKKLNKNRKKK